MFISISTIYFLFSMLAFLLVLLIILTHIYSRFIRPKPLKLTSDSIVVIIGACTGIGRVMAIEIARKYHSTILLVDRRKDLFEKVSEQIKQEKALCECFLCDLSDVKSVEKLIESLKQQRGRINFLIYNAAIMVPSLTWQTKEEELQNVMNVNFFSPVKIINGLFSRLIDGHIAVIASTASLADGGVQLSSYVSSKHALFGYFNVMRQELKKVGKNVTLSIACPYAINTTLFQGFKSRVDKILPVLDENYVGTRLVREFVAKKQVCFVGRKHGLMLKVLRFFPTWLQDWFYLEIVQADFTNKKRK